MATSISSLLQYPSKRVILILALSLSAVLLFFLARPQAGGLSFLPKFDAQMSTGFSKKSAAQIIQNSTLGFEKIYAINLPHRTDHRDGLVLASTVSNFKVEFIDGVPGDTIKTKALPPYYNSKLGSGAVGAWRAHINAIRRVVEIGASTALIFEDDVDWDVRLRDILDNFATASRSLNKLSGHQTSFDHLQPAEINGSPYGNDWDLLWFGHCGMKLPEEGLVVQEADETVPQAHYVKTYDVNDLSPLEQFRPHTRVYSKITDNTCSLAYAVSQRGARFLLNDLGLKHLDQPFDKMLSAWCADPNSGTGPHVCFSVLPQVFDHFRREGSTEQDSDITAHSTENREKAHTLNVRWSVRMNIDKILRGETDYVDQYPDT